MTVFPSEIADKLAAIDKDLAEGEANRTYHSAALDRAITETRMYLAIRNAIVETAEICARSEPAADALPSCPPPFDKDEAARDYATPLMSERKRRDIRGEVLAYLKACTCASASAIALGINAPLSAVERALAYHERDGRAVEKPGGVWQTTVMLPIQKPQPMTVTDLQDAGLSVTEIEHVETEPQSLLPIEKTPDQVLDFLRRCGDMGAGKDQLRLINAPGHVLADLIERGIAWLDNNGRWYAEPVENDSDGAEENALFKSSRRTELK